MPQLPSDTNVYFVDNIDTAMEMKRWLGQTREVLGVDTETTGLDAYAPGANIRLIQLGDKKTGWAVPFEMWGGVAMECLNSYEGELAFHNVDFDAPWLAKFAKYRIPWHRTHDTMVMSQIESPGGSHKLKELSTRHVDPRADVGQKDLKNAFKRNGWDWATVPLNLEEYWFYSGLDPVLNSHLFSHFRTDLKYPEVYDLEMAVRRVCTNMSMNGMRVDLDYSSVKYKELSDYVEKAKTWAKDNWGVDIGSNPQLAAFLQQNGAEFSYFSEKTNAPSVAKDQLGEFLKAENDFVKGVAEFVIRTRNAEKMGNTYFKGFLDSHNDGLLHAQIKTMGARTHRMSVTKPALQTIPRGDALVRDAFIPVRENDLIISCDYSQVEMRLLSHFSRDDRLQKAFKEADATGGDFFVTLGKDIYADPNFSKKDSRRGLVKGTMYGAAYGSGIQKMADTAGVTYEQMAEVSATVFKNYPGIKRFMTEVESMGKSREREEGQGYILTEMGRRLPADIGKLYALTNYTLQGTAAELMKKAIVRLDAAGYADFMCMPIHDEMIFSLPASETDDAMKEIAELMSYCNGEFLVDLPAEPEGPLDRWGTKYRKEGEIFGYDTSSLLEYS